MREKKLISIALLKEKNQAFIFTVSDVSLVVTDEIILNAIKYMATENMNRAKVLFRKSMKILLKRYPTIQEEGIFGYHFSIEITGEYGISFKDAWLNSVSKTIGLKKGNSKL